MLRDITDRKILCPHCGHNIHVAIDTSEADQDYYESCPACCHEVHMNMHIEKNEDKLNLTIDADDEQFF